MFTKNLPGFLFAVAATIAWVRADDPAPTTTLSGTSAIPSGLSSCATQCVTQAALKDGCTDTATQIQCICNNPLLVPAAVACMEQQCTPQDSAAAVQVYQQVCSASAPPGSATAAPTATGIGSLTSALPSSASASTSESDHHDSASTSETSKHSDRSSSSGALSSSTSVSQSTVKTVSVSHPVSAEPAGATTTVLPTTASPLAAGVNASSGSATSIVASSSGFSSAPPAPSSSASAASQTKNAAMARRVMGAGSGMSGAMGMGVAILGVVLGAGFIL